MKTASTRVSFSVFCHNGKGKPTLVCKKTTNMRKSNQHIARPGATPERGFAGGEFFRKGRLVGVRFF